MKWVPLEAHPHLFLGVPTQPRGLSIEDAVGHVQHDGGPDGEWGWAVYRTAREGRAQSEAEARSAVEQEIGELQAPSATPAAPHSGHRPGVARKS